MIIDAHTHLGFNDVVDATPEQLIASMDAAGIGRSLVLAGEINGCPTEKLLGIVAAHGDRFAAVGSISPLSQDAPSVDAIERWLKEGKICGLKFYPGYEFFHPWDAALRPYLELLASYERPAIFHCGDTFSKVHSAKLKYAHPLHIDDLAVEMPELCIVMSHLGYPWIVDAAEVYYKNHRVHADCSGFVYGEFSPDQSTHFAQVFADFLRIGGTAERLLFGSDWPVSNQASYLRTVDALVPEGDKARFFGGNARELFGF